MNKPYTCHNCGTEFDLWPDDLLEQFNVGQGTPSVGPDKVKVKCPGCYGNGYTSVSQMIYTVDATTTPPTVVE